MADVDTSTVIPLFVDEPGSDAPDDFWDRALRVVSVRLVRVEARAGLAEAARIERTSRAQLRAFVRELEELLDQLDFVDVDEELVRNAADLAESHSLRAYDAVHNAAALTAASDDLVLVAGDRALLSAARLAGLSTAAIG